MLAVLARIDAAKRRKALLDDDPRVAQCVGAVEANSFERHVLWKEYAVDAAKFRADQNPRNGVNWKQDNGGYGLKLGELAGMPVFMSFSFATIDGHVVMFYEPTSMVVDHRMVEEYLEVNFGKAEGGLRGGKVVRTDASNFHNVVHHIYRLNNKE